VERCCAAAVRVTADAAVLRLVDYPPVCGGMQRTISASMTQTHAAAVALSLALLNHTASFAAVSDWTTTSGAAAVYAAVLVPMAR
jgi:hypothetical protein